MRERARSRRGLSQVVPSDSVARVGRDDRFARVSRRELYRTTDSCTQIGGGSADLPRDRRAFASRFITRLVACVCEHDAEEGRARRELDTLAWVGRIQDALDQGRFVLYSQPIVPLAGGQPSQELLLRMRGQGGEIIAPGSFLPVAEKYGQIGEMIAG
jgi:hypothetical protein